MSRLKHADKRQRQFTAQEIYRQFTDNLLLRKGKLEINAVVHKVIVYMCLFLDVSRISFIRAKGRFCNASTDFPCPKFIQMVF